MRKLFGHKEAALSILVVLLWLGLVAEVWVAWPAFVLTALAYVASAEGKKA